MNVYRTLLAARLVPVVADISWPVYNQQCRDDAGPPYADDEPGVKYHAGSAASPVLLNGECSDPIKAACVSRQDAKTAYLEGPIDCGNNGWYCRIFNDEANGWPNVVLNSDLNFDQCNTEEAFGGLDNNQDGHCHGSSDDSTYYWWVRDHWFRQYNGKVRCCCGWYAGGTQPLAQGRIASRCDYRRLVTQSENLDACRDANEDHDLTFEGGCDPQYRDQIGVPIPEDDSVCWEIERFGFVDDDSSSPPGSGDEDQSPPGSGDEDQSPPGSGDQDPSPPGSGDEDQSPPGSGDENETPPGSGDEDESPPGSGDENEQPTGKSAKSGKGSRRKSNKTAKSLRGTARVNPFS